VILTSENRRELEEASAIDAEVIAERGYETVFNANHPAVADLGLGKELERESA